MIKSICIVRLSALGDVLMLVPLIRTLQANFPNATLTWIISQPAYALVEGLSGVEFVVIDKPNTVCDYWRFNMQMRARHFDVLLATQASLRANLLYPLIRASRKIGYDSVRAKDGQRWFVHEAISPGRDHTLDGFLRFAEALGVVKKDIRWDLPIQQTDREWAAAHCPEGKFKLVINPAASQAERTWPVERYIDLIQQAIARWGVQVILTGGPGAQDKALGEAIEQAVLVTLNSAVEFRVTNLIGQTKPRQLLALIELADVVVCPDTGPAHMAAAMGTPVVALHAVTNPKLSGPYTYRHLVVDYYPQAVEKILNKSAATVTWGTQVHGVEPMRLIGVDAVLSKLGEVLI